MKWKSKTHISEQFHVYIYDIQYQIRYIAGNIWLHHDRKQPFMYDMDWWLAGEQNTHNIHPVLGQRWAIVCDAVPTLAQHWDYTPFRYE